MITINQDLQASYQIVSTLEKSKANLESIIDRLPDIFVVINDKGLILKGNIEASKRLGEDVERLLGMSVFGFFSEESGNVFKEYLVKAFSNIPTEKPIEFELAIDKNSMPERICYWSISPLIVNQSTGTGLFCVIGRDITLLRAYEKQLSDIFSKIPLGIFTVNKSGKIEEPFSSYIRWLLGTEDIAGKSLSELLYKPASDFLDTMGHEGWKNLLNFANFSPKEFEIFGETFPTQFYYPMPNSNGESGRYLGMKVQPIARGPKVSGLLVILEDRTTIVESEKANEKNKLLGDASLERVLQIKSGEPQMMAIILSDLRALFSQLGTAISSKDEETFRNILHSIKGNARIIGLSTLMKLSHAFESRLNEGRNAPFDWRIVFTLIDDIRHEWKEIYALAKVLLKDELHEIQSSSDSLDHEGQGSSSSSSVQLNILFEKFLEKMSAQSITPELQSISQEIRRQIHKGGCKRLGDIEPILRHGFQTTSQALGKSARLVINWEKDCLIQGLHLLQLRVCFMHLINNALDHGIESPEVRSERKKSPQGIISIDSYSVDKRIVFTLEDDGQGIDVKKVGQIAIQKGLRTPEEIAKLTSDEVRQLIFSQGFSTAENITEISGRGAGLSAVKDVVENLGGTIEVTTSKLGGTSFKFYIEIEPDIADAKKASEIKPSVDVKEPVQAKNQVESKDQSELKGQTMKKILIVDDSKTIRFSLRRTLETAGYEIAEAVDGLDALKKLKEAVYNLILTDINMPEMDGLTMCRKIKESPEHSKTPIFVISTEGSPEMKATAKQIGITAWMTKPPNPEKLVEAVGKIIGR